MAARVWAPRAGAARGAERARRGGSRHGGACEGSGRARGWLRGRRQGSRLRVPRAPAATASASRARP
eukprot:3459134-Prymnesium_polylepis.1